MRYKTLRAGRAIDWLYDHQRIGNERSKERKSRDALSVVLWSSDPSL
jgi:hypothetical protein